MRDKSVDDAIMEKSGSRRADAVANQKNEKDEMEEVEKEERESWGSQWEFFFSIVGLSVGIGNVWRFPYLAYQNGGGSFFIAYLILMMLLGKPLYYMELAIGQFCGQGTINMWRLCPAGVGVGVAQCVMTMLVAIYYNVLMAYCLFYIFASFQSVVPWSVCSEDWWQGVGADDRCYERITGNETTTTNGTRCAAADGICETSAEQYYNKVVLGVREEDIEAVLTKDGNYTYYALYHVGQIGPVKWDLMLCLLLSWIIVCTCLAKGIKSSGKVVYFTATFPYVLLITLLIYGCTLPGAADGISSFFIPKSYTGPKSISDPEVWRKAAEQIFYSLGIAWGGLNTYGSYNKFNHKVHLTATVLSSIDFATSIIATVVIASVLGQMKLEAGLSDISSVVKSGPGLAFIVYPEALSRLYPAQLWSIVFFFMLFLLGLDSEFGSFETVLTAICDRFPQARTKKPLIITSLCTASFLLSLPCVTTSGTFIFQIMDEYGGGGAILWIAVFECVVIFWMYGAWNLAADFDFMLKVKTNIVLKILWMMAPVLLAVLLGMSLRDYEEPKASRSTGDILYPDWIHSVGIFLILIALVQIPVWGLVTALHYARSPDLRLRDVFRPAPEWGPKDPKTAREYWSQRTPKGLLSVGRRTIEHSREYLAKKRLKPIQMGILGPYQEAQ